LFSVGRKACTLGGAAGRITSWLSGIKLTQIIAILVALMVVAPPGFQIVPGTSKFLAPLRIGLIPFEASVQTRPQLPVQRSEARLSQNRISLGLAATLFAVPPIRNDRPPVVTSNYRHRSDAHALALLRAPPPARSGSFSSSIV
jgi:hypothetical protein